MGAEAGFGLPTDGLIPGDEPPVLPVELDDGGCSGWVGS